MILESRFRKSRTFSHSIFMTRHTVVLSFLIVRAAVGQTESPRLTEKPTKNGSECCKMVGLGPAEFADIFVGVFALGLPNGGAHDEKLQH